MLISQLARMVGVDTQTIRFYERQGLLPPPDRQENGYRIYTEKHTEQLAATVGFWTFHCLRFPNCRNARAIRISLVPSLTSWLTSISPMCGRG